MEEKEDDIDVVESYEDIKTFDDDHLPELEVIFQELGKSQTEDAEHEILQLQSCTKTDVDRSIDDQSSRALVLPILQSTTVFKFTDKKFSKPAESVSEAELKREPIQNENPLPTHNPPNATSISGAHTHTGSLI